VKLSGVKLRAIQLYEQNQLDLRCASVSSVLALANTLGCAIEDLVWQPIALEEWAWRGPPPATPSLL